MAALDEAQLLEKLRAGDPMVASAFHQRVRPAIERTLRRLLLDSGGERDALIALSLVRPVQSIDGYRGESALESWSAAITAQVVCQQLRREKRERALFAWSEDAGAGDWAPDERARLERVHGHLERLAPRSAAAFVLHDVLGYGLEELALILDCSTTAAQALLARGRGALEQRLREGGERTHDALERGDANAQRDGAGLHHDTEQNADLRQPARGGTRGETEQRADAQPYSLESATALLRRHRAAALEQSTPVLPQATQVERELAALKEALRARQNRARRLPVLRALAIGAALLLATSAGFWAGHRAPRSAVQRTTPSVGVALHERALLPGELLRTAELCAGPPERTRDAPSGGEPGGAPQTPARRAAPATDAPSAGEVLPLPKDESGPAPAAPAE